MAGPDADSSARPTTADEVRALGRLAVPLVLMFAGSQLLGAVDAAVVGRLGAAPLAAVGLGNNLYFFVSCLGLGWMVGIDPLVSQSLGAGERTEARRVVWQGIWVALTASAPLALCILAVGAALPAFGVTPSSAEATQPYLLARVFGLPFGMGLWAARSTLSAFQRTRPLVVSVVVANALNVPLSILLVHGDGALLTAGLPAVGLPGYGATGAGVGTSIALAVQLLVVLPVLAGEEVGVLRTFFRPHAADILRILRLGTPVGLQLLAEIGSFTVVTVLIGGLGELPLSAHSVAIVIIAFTFTAALGLGTAARVRVGHAVGAGDRHGARRAGFVAFGMILAVMGVAAASFVLAPRAIAGLITDQSDILDAVVPLLAVAAAFQLFDGLQTVGAGALQGAGDTRFSLLSNLVGHYVVGIPLGLTLGLGLGWGAVGLWWGLAAGLTAVALALVARFHRLTLRPIARS